MDPSDTPPPESQPEQPAAPVGTIRVHPTTRVLVEKLHDRYGIPMTRLVHVSLELMEDHCLRRDYVQLPALTHEVISLGNRLQLLSAQLQNFEQLADLVTVVTDEQGDLD